MWDSESPSGARGSFHPGNGAAARGHAGLGPPRVGGAGTVGNAPDARMLDDWLRGLLEPIQNSGPSNLVGTPCPVVTEAARAAPQTATAAGREAAVLAALAALDAAGMTDIRESAMFMAQMSHESAGFTRLEENLNYSAQRLRNLYPHKFATERDAENVVAQGQKAIAERIYGKRPKLGNVHPSDGYKFRGRGIVQLTGRDNYRRAGGGLGIDLEACPDRVAELDTAILTALWFWRSDSKLVGAARAGNVDLVTRRVNGGLNGLADRQRKYEEWLARLQGEAWRGNPPRAGAKP
jgi:predicted chitinase